MKVREGDRPRLMCQTFTEYTPDGPKIVHTERCGERVTVIETGHGTRHEPIVKVRTDDGIEELVFASALRP